MNPLESPWFFRMVEDEARQPTERLLAVFRVAEKWIAAPGIREALVASHDLQVTGMQASQPMKHYLTQLASSAGAEKPEILASHLLILLQGAVMEELRNPELRALSEAANAAGAVIAQSRKQLRRQRNMLSALGGLAATVAVTLAGWHVLSPSPAAQAGSNAVIIAANKAVLLPTGVSPSDMEAVLTLHEQFERGVCPAPHLLALPPGQMIAYTNVINFRTPENPAADRENLRAFMTWFNRTQSAECYYAPRNGHTTVSWTQG